MEPTQIVDLLPSMHRGQRSICHVLEKRKVKAIKMEMENIEVARTLSDLRQHGEMSRNVPGKLLVQPEGHLSAWNDFRACFAITTSEQHYLMTALNQRVA